jgi:hypothetical protein
MATAVFKVLWVFIVSCVRAARQRTVDDIQEKAEAMTRVVSAELQEIDTSWRRK